MPQKFDPTQYKNKKTIYRPIPDYQGIYSIWDWSKPKARYIKRTIGNKFYASKRVGHIQRTKCFIHLEQAKAWRRDADGYEWLEGPVMYFKDLTVLFFTRKATVLRVSSLETYKSKIKHLKFFDDYEVQDITTRVIDRWLEHVKSEEYLSTQHKSRISYAKELELLKQVLGYYKEYICEDVAFNMPVKKRHHYDCIVNKAKYDLVKAKNKHKFLPDTIVKRFLSELQMRGERRSLYKVYYLLAFFQYSTGVRIGEACALKWEVFDSKEGKAFISKNVCWSRKKGRATFISELTKTGESRWIFLTPQLVRMLNAWQMSTGKRSGLIFSYDGVTPLSYRKIQYNYDNALKSVGADWSGTHILRHSFATNFLEKTGEQKALQAQLGHQTAEQTDHYAKITEKLQRSAMTKYAQRLEDENLEIKSC